jgi:nickel transport protein
MFSRASALTIAVALLCLSHAAAHALLADVRAGKDRVTVEAFFDDDTPAAQALVKVFDSGKKIVAEGKTDTKGVWTFPLPPPGEYQLVVDAGAGHRATKKLVVSARNQSTDNAAAAEHTFPDNSSRWLKVAIGLSAIAAISAGYLLSRRLTPRPPTASTWRAPEISPK